MGMTPEEQRIKNKIRICNINCYCSHEHFQPSLQNSDALLSLLEVAELDQHEHVRKCIKGWSGSLQLLPTSKGSINNNIESQVTYCNIDENL